MSVKLYTKTGDKGQSNVIAGIRLPKDHAVFEVVGTLDELNSWLGHGLVLVEDEDLRPELLRIQDALLNLGAIIAGSEKIDLQVTDISELEKRIDYYQKHTRDDWYTTFLLPGGTELASRLDVARTVCRRLERNLVTLSKQKETRLYVVPQALKEVQAYINRLSDYLFALRCYLNSVVGYEEHAYTPKLVKKLQP